MILSVMQRSVLDSVFLFSFVFAEKSSLRRNFLAHLSWKLKKTHSMVGRNEHSLLLHYMTELRLASALVRYLYAYGPRSSNSMVPYLSVIFCSTVLGNKEKGVDSQTKKIDSWNSSNSNFKNLIFRKMFS